MMLKFGEKMALTKAELKLIVKECLIEILSEGLGNSSQAMRMPPVSRVPISGAVREQRSQNTHRKQDFDPRLDTPVNGTRQASNALKEAIKKESGGNPILADILADTAMTTLPSMLSNGDNMGQMSESGAGISRNHAPSQQEQFNGNPDDVFGAAATLRPDGSSHWADLAFMSTGKKSA